MVIALRGCALLNAPLVLVVQGDTSLIKSDSIKYWVQQLSHDSMEGMLAGGLLSNVNCCNLFGVIIIPFVFTIFRQILSCWQAHRICITIRWRFMEVPDYNLMGTTVRAFAITLHTLFAAPVN